MNDQNPASDKNILGQIDPKVVETLRRLQQASKDATFELGTLDLRKAQILGNINTFSSQMQQLLRNEGTRLEIPPNAQWYMDEDGNAVAMGQ
jgi:hypothetical protein